MLQFFDLTGRCLDLINNFFCLRILLCLSECFFLLITPFILGDFDLLWLLRSNLLCCCLLSFSLWHLFAPAWLILFLLSSSDFVYSLSCFQLVNGILKDACLRIGRTLFIDLSFRLKMNIFLLSHQWLFTLYFLLSCYCLCNHSFMGIGWRCCCSRCLFLFLIFWCTTRELLGFLLNFLWFHKTSKGWGSIIAL